MDQSRPGCRQPLGAIHTLVNMRQSATQLGVIEQTPRFKSKYVLGPGTYWNAGSQAEPAGSAVTFISDLIYITEYCVYAGSSQLPVFYQTTAPAASTLLTSCQLVINSVAGLAIALGNTVDVEMTGGAAFRWRKNGGAWNAAVPAITGVSIDGGNATLYFLANSGFAGTETWSWTRTDRSTYTTLVGTEWGAIDAIHYKGKMYYVSAGGRVMIIKNDNSPTKYVISAGYRPLYSQTLTIFQDHLILGGFGTAPFNYQKVPEGRTVGWSDVGDLENFVATDVNEADSYTLQAVSTRDVPSDLTTTIYITGVEVWNEILYVFTPYGSFQTSYLGLPIVFSFSPSANIGTPTAPGKYVVKGTTGLYVLTQDDVILFNGSGIASIGAKICNMLAEFYPVSVTKTKFCSLLYNQANRELVLVMYNNWGLLTYQEKYDTWYYRPFSDSGGSGGRPRCVGIANPSASWVDTAYQIGLANRHVIDEDLLWAAAPVYDDVLGTTWVKPAIIFHPMCWSLATVKEMNHCYLGLTTVDFSRGTVTPSAVFYSTGSNIRLKLSWLSCPDGKLDIMGTWLTDSAAYVTNATDGWVSINPVSFRGLALKLTLEGATLPPAWAGVTWFEPQVRGAPVER